MYSFEEEFEIARWKSWIELLAAAAVGFVTLLLIQWIFPQAVPFGTFEFWALRGSIAGALKVSWPLFAWALVINLVAILFIRNGPRDYRHAEKILGREAFASVFAGIVEEIDFRWLIFLNAIWFVKLTNWLFFGFAGFGIEEWLFLHIIGPVVNFSTLGKLAPILFHELGWFVGASVLAANAKFRDGHKYQGLFGVINSWFIGFFLFWLMFNYGLVACIVVHMLYDLFIDLIRYLDMVVERALD